jgi:hypothetical protein
VVRGRDPQRLTPVSAPAPARGHTAQARTYIWSRALSKTRVAQTRARAASRHGVENGERERTTNQVATAISSAVNSL